LLIPILLIFLVVCPTIVVWQKNATTTKKKAVKRSYIWLPRPLWQELWRAGLVPETSQKGRNVNVAIQNSEHGKKLRRLLRQYRADLKRAANDAAQGVAANIVKAVTSNAA
jgi:hypothetical protein